MNSFKKYLMLCALLLTGGSLYAQDQIEGRVVDEQLRPIPFANVVLLNANDSSFVHGSVTKDDGTFIITPIKQDCLLKVSSIGYKKKYIHIGKGNIGDIQILSDTQLLNEIVVKGKTNPLSVQNGAFTLNVSNSFLKEQPDIYSVMAFLPFVESSEGKVNVIGAGNILYLINGREVRSMAEIESLRPDMIKKISLDTHPSAEYSSKYGAVISITTITRLKDFVNSQLSHKSIFSRKYSDIEGININANSGHLTHFLSYQFKDLHKKEWAENDYKLFDEPSVLSCYNYSENHSKDKNRQHELIYSTGLTIDKHNYINFQYLMEAGTDKDKVNTNERTVIGTTTTERYTDQNNSEANQCHSFDLLYKHNSSLSSLSIDGSYTFAISNNKYLIMTNSKDLNRMNGNNRYYVYTSQADYSLQTFWKIKLQAGLKYTYTHNVGLSDSSNPETNNVYFHNDTYLNDAVTTGYLNLSKQIGSLYVTAGLRGEYYHSDYRQNDQSLYSRNEFTPYPSIQVNYTASPKFIASIGFISKSLRPTFSELSPVVRYINAMLYEQGNPELNMTTINKLFASLVISQRLLIQLSYQHDHNYVMYAFKSNPQVLGNIISSPVNVDARYFMLNASYSNKLSFYRFSYNANIHYDATSIPVKGHEERHFSPRFLISTINQFDIARQTVAFCDLGIASSYWSLGNNFKPQYKLRIGIFKTFFADKRLTVTLSANDLLRRTEPDSETEYGYVWSRQQMHLDSRNITLNVKYNINKFKNVFKKNSNNNEEITRIK